MAEGPRWWLSGNELRASFYINIARRHGRAWAVRLVGFSPGTAAVSQIIIILLIVRRGRGRPNALMASQHVRRPRRHTRPAHDRRFLYGFTPSRTSYRSTHVSSWESLFSAAKKPPVDERPFPFPPQASGHTSHRTGGAGRLLRVRAFLLPLGIPTVIQIQSTCRFPKHSVTNLEIGGIIGGQKYL